MRASGDLDINALDFFTVNFSDYFTNNRTMLGLALLAASALASDTSRVEPCTFLDKMAGYPGVNGTRWCRSSAVEEYRLCPRRAPGDVVCQATLAPRATVCVETKPK